MHIRTSEALRPEEGKWGTPIAEDGIEQKTNATSACGIRPGREFHEEARVPKPGSLDRVLWLSLAALRTPVRRSDWQILLNSILLRSWSEPRHREHKLLMSNKSGYFPGIKHERGTYPNHLPRSCRSPTGPGINKS